MRDMVIALPHFTSKAYFIYRLKAHSLLYDMIVAFLMYFF